MKLSVLTTAVAATTVALAASNASAAVTTDNHGNVGYDSYDECVSAVKAGTAKFYTPYTHEQPKLGRGETAVRKATLAEVTIPSSVSANMPLQTREYSAGACDLGVGRSNGRSGVSAVLVGKYVPFAPDMPVNVYMNRNGVPVRVTMQQCDNHFSSKFPIPVISEMKAPPAQVRIEEDTSFEPVKTSETRTIRRSTAVRPSAPTMTKPVVRQVGDYEVQEVIQVPQSQIRRVNTSQGTQVVVQDAPGQAIVVGEEVDPAILDKAVNTPELVPVVEVPVVKPNVRTIN